MTIDRKDMRMVRSSLYTIVLAAVASGSLMPLQAAEIALYDATYRVVTGDGGGEPGQSGEIRQRLGRECRDWVYSQDAEFELPDNQAMAWQTSTRESMDATEYQFDMTTRSDGSLDHVQGTAVMNAYSGRAVFTGPESAVLRMEPETLFPTQFTSALIDRAESGDRYFSVPVFSGVDGRQVVQVTAVIGDPFDAPPAGTTASLLGHRGWPITLAYFNDGGDGDMRYQVHVDLLENGIARSIEFQDGDLRLSISISTIEFVAPADC